MAQKPRGRPKAFNDKTDQNTVQALDRGLDILTHVALNPGRTLSEIAEDTGEAIATVFRALVTLQGHGMVEVDEPGQFWHIGPGAFLIGSTFLRRTSLIERARPILRGLMEQTGETANLGIESEGSVLFVSQVETHAALRAFFPPGTRSPLHASGIGKTLLAWDPARLERLLAAGLAGFTPQTLTDPAALQAELATIRARGHAVDHEERTEGMRCVAAPIRNTFGEIIAGISVSGPVSRVTPERVPAIAAAVVEAAAAVSAALGARPIRPPSG